MENRRQQPEQIRKENAEKQPERSYIPEEQVVGDMALRILVRKLRHL